MSTLTFRVASRSRAPLHREIIQSRKNFVSPIIFCDTVKFQVLERVIVVAVFIDAQLVDGLFILEWTTSLDTSSRTLFVRMWGCGDVVMWGCPRHVECRVT